MTYSKGSLWRLLRCRIIRQIMAVINNRHIKTATLYIIFCSAIGKHCLPLFFFTIDFCMFFVFLMFCLMPFLRSLFHWEGFCFPSTMPSSSLLMPCSVVYFHFIAKFLFVFYGILFMFLVIRPSNVCIFFFIQNISDSDWDEMLRM